MGSEIIQEGDDIPDLVSLSHLATLDKPHRSWSKSKKGEDRLRFLGIA